MALRFGLSFDHLDNMVATDANWARLMANCPFQQRGTSGAKTPNIVDGWMGSTVAASTATVYNALKTNAFTPVAAKKTWIGIRVKVSALGSAALATPVMYVCNPGWTGGSLYTQPFSIAQLSAVLANALNKEVYLEIGINWDTKVIERRVDGEPIADMAAASWAGSDAAYGNRNVDILICNSIASNHVMVHRDVYYCDTMNDTSLQGPLGPQQAVLAEETVVTPTDWAPSSGATVQGVLNLKVGSTANTDTPTLSSQGNGVPLELDLKVPTGIKLGTIRGVTTWGGGALITGAGSNLTTSLKYAGNAVAGKSILLNATMSHGVLLACNERAPDGTVWNKTKIEATRLAVNIT